MNLNTEKDNHFLLKVAMFWRYHIVKILTKNLFQSVFFTCSISDHCDETQSHFQGARG